MNIKSRLTFQIEKKAFRELVALIKNPVKFFEKNESTKEDCLNFLTFVIRLSLIIDFIFIAISKTIFGKNTSILFYFWILAFVILILIIKVIAVISLFVLSHLWNISARIIGGKNNILASQRVVSYNSSVYLIYSFIPRPNIGIAIIILRLILDTIGIFQQYRLTILKSFLIAIGPLIIIGLFIYFIFGPQEFLMILKKDIFN